MRFMSSAEAALSILSAATRVRVAMQHEAAAAELPDRLRLLGVSYPPSDWREAWEIVRSHATAALLTLAEAVRSIALSHSP